MTLIEVLAAIALLGILLSSTLLAIGRQTRQARDAQDQIAALDTADAMLRRLLIEERGAIDAIEGDVEGRPEWRWRLAGRSEPELEQLGVHIARLEIFDRGRDDGVRVLASLEFLSASAATTPATGTSSTP